MPLAKFQMLWGDRRRVKHGPCPCMANSPLAMRRQCMGQRMAVTILNESVTCQVSTETKELYDIIHTRCPEAEKGEMSTC